MVPALQPERGRQVSYPDQCLFYALLLSGFTGIKLIYSHVWVNAQTCYSAFPEEIMVDKCVSVLLCYQRMESGFSIITSSATLGTRYAQHVWSDSHTKGSFLPFSHTLLQFALDMGLLGILQHNASHTEQPLIDLRNGFPLLVLKQHCRSAPEL